MCYHQWKFPDELLIFPQQRGCSPLWSPSGATTDSQEIKCDLLWLDNIRKEHHVNLEQQI